MKRINRRDFLATTAAAGVLFNGFRANAQPNRKPNGQELAADVVIIGGSLGGCAAALAALRNGLRVVMTEETDWIGGQLTSQAVPPDEHSRIETRGKQ